MYSIYNSFYNLLYPIKNISVNNISLKTEEELPNVTCNSIINPIEEYYNPDKVTLEKLTLEKVNIEDKLTLEKVNIEDKLTLEKFNIEDKLTLEKVNIEQVNSEKVTLENKEINIQVNNIYNFDMDELELNDIIKIKDIDMSIMLLKAISDLID